jgi:hypothetical protein
MAQHNRDMESFEAWDFAATQGQFPFRSDPLNEKRERRMSAGELIAHPTEWWGVYFRGNGIVEITANIHFDKAWSAALFESQYEFVSEDKLGQWISWDFKALRVEQRTTRSGRTTEFVT